MKHKDIRALRWVTLVAILFNVSFNFISERLYTFGENIKEVTEKYNSLFTPAGYAFSIWGVIYLSFIAYGIYQLMPSQRHIKLHDELSLPLIFSNVLTSVWVVIFRHDLIALSVVTMLLTLIVGLMMYTRARAAVLKEGFHRWISVPFSLFAGWISVASIANISIWLSSRGWKGGGWGEITWTIIMVIVAGVLGVLVSYRFRDLIYPLVVAWACVAIFVARNPEYSTISMIAMGAAITLVVAIILLMGAKRDQRLHSQRERIVPSSPF